MLAPAVSSSPLDTAGALALLSLRLYPCLHYEAIALAGMGQDPPDQCRVGDLRGSGGGGKARVAGRIRCNPWQRVELQNLRLPLRIETHVDTAPIPTLQRHKGSAAHIGDGAGEVSRDLGWTAQDIAGLWRRIPEPFGGIRLQGSRARWQHSEADLDQWQDRNLRAIPQQSYCKLPPSQKSFDERRLVIRLQHVGDAPLQRRWCVDDRGICNAL